MKNQTSMDKEDKLGLELALFLQRNGYIKKDMKSNIDHLGKVIGGFLNGKVK